MDNNGRIAGPDLTASVVPSTTVVQQLATQLQCMPLLPPVFDDSTSRAAFRIQFVSVAVASGWSLTDQARVLAAQLHPPASDVLEYLTEHTRLDYPSLITAMEDRIGDTRFQQLHCAELKRVRQQGITLEDLANRVKRLTHKAAAGSSNATKDLIGPGAFLDALENQNVKRFVRLALPMTLRDALGLTIEA
ncbi:hypothetical protein HPB48_022870 [Haemaphysalis longicornis]|uniref:Uncharacterized protein n=1 Tax=Haemaphysalis longicornis TaxID=44386 RepID=A0A9J6GYI2_HAELO|nr:hypothetical protein HPB48_022870 [Haemaphysalis longicornis]